MRFALTLIFAMMIASNACAAPKYSALEDWKTYRSTDHTDTLIVDVAFDSVWTATAATLDSFALEVALRDHAKGLLATVWDEMKEFAPYHGAEVPFIEGTVGSLVPPMFSSPECPRCWFTEIDWRRLIQVERESLTRTRVIARTQVVGVPRGKTEAIALVSTGSSERAFLKRLRERLGQ